MRLNREHAESKYLTPEVERILDAEWEELLAYWRANPPDCSKCSKKMEYFEQVEGGVMFPMFRCKCGHEDDPGLSEEEEEEA